MSHRILSIKFHVLLKKISSWITLYDSLIRLFESSLCETVIEYKPHTAGRLYNKTGCWMEQNKMRIWKALGKLNSTIDYVGTFVILLHLYAVLLSICWRLAFLLANVDLPWRLLVSFEEVFGGTNWNTGRFLWKNLVQIFRLNLLSSSSFFSKNPLLTSFF